MADPIIQQDGGILGVKLASLVAGFAGGVVSLSFLRGLSAGQAVLAVFAGTVSAGYLSPLVQHYLGIVTPEAANAASFVIGLTAMNIIPGLVKLSEAFKRDPRAFIGGGEK